jgi:glycosyltransferase involved in cell wall biosynthesis
MRIAIVHSFYRSGQPSGENTVVLSQVEGLMRRGHDVRLIARYSDDEVESRLFPFRAAARVVSGHGPSPIQELTEFKPDVLHIHNLFPGFGTNWLDKWNGGVVATLHNFRPLCANGLLFRNGRFCDDCQTSSWLAGARHRCYHDSSLATMPLSIRNSRGLANDSVIRRANVLILLSEAAADVYRRFGLRDDLIRVIPNGIPEPKGIPTVARANWTAAGRLTSEKGFLELVSSWPRGKTLSLFGDGPDLAALEGLGHPDVHIMGQVPREQLLRRIAGSVGLLFPSLCLDSQPTIVTEALAVGTPIVAKQKNSVAQFVLDKGCGTTYEGVLDLVSALDEIEQDFARVSENATAVFRDSLTADRWLDSLESVYSSVAQTHRST